MIENRAGVDVETLARLEAIVVEHRLLEDVVRWAHRHPPAAVVDVVVQDETNHDVVVALEAPLHLVYSTT